MNFSYVNSEICSLSVKLSIYINIKREGQTNESYSFQDVGNFFQFDAESCQTDVNKLIITSKISSLFYRSFMQTLDTNQEFTRRFIFKIRSICYLS